MVGQGSPWRVWLVIGAVAGWGAMSDATGLAQTHRSTPVMREDAELADVFFLDPDRGWAVGDRGAIWATDNGGRHWRMQMSGVDCRLESVHFVDDHHGWAVGGNIEPLTHRGSAVVLATADGGQTWKRIEAATLPRLRQVRFRDRQVGWACGDGSPMYPAGMFQTDDGGLSWATLPLDGGGHWLASDMNERGEAISADRDGRVWRLSSSGQRPCDAPPVIGSRIRRLKMTGGGTGFIVGDRGLLLRTADHGLSWRPATLPLSEEAARQCDWRAVALWGAHVWIAGAPGNLVLHSADGGDTWQTHATAQPLPIRAVTFIDEYRGWAVGSLGTILATRDGGQSWRPQRQGGGRAAMLALFSEAESVPLEAISLLAGEDGYLSAVELVNHRGLEIRETAEVDLVARSREAMISAGASAADVMAGFPLRQRGLDFTAERTLASWEFLHRGEARERLIESLAARIRQWRPNVVLTEPLQVAGDGTLTQMLNQAVLSAVERAADPRAFPAQTQQLGLAPWAVDKVFCAETDSRLTGTILVTARLSANLGCSLVDQAATARGLIHDRYTVAPASYRFRPLVNRLAHVSDHRDMFTGINLPHGSEARRIRGASVGGNLGELARSVQRQRSVQQLLARGASSTDATASTNAAWLGQVDELLSGLSENHCAELLAQLAQQYAEQGQWELAMEVHLRLLRRAPRHAYASASYLWLAKYAASAEVARAMKDRHGMLEAGQAVAGQAAEEAGGKALRTGVVRTGYTTPFGPTVVADARIASEAGIDDSKNRPAGYGSAGYGSAASMSLMDRGRIRTHILQLGREVQASRPTLFADPRWRSPLAVVQRWQGLDAEAQTAWQAMSRGRDDGGWAERAAAELWLSDEQGRPPAPQMVCSATVAKPRLDGKLDEPFWAAATPANLASGLSDDADWPAEVRMAHDQDFLYVAVQCRKAAGVDYSPSAETRPRDADLSARDRVDILLDIDRDASTFFRLTVDYRGWTREQCWESLGWNPNWYVAAAETETAWTIEAAIPRDELNSSAWQPMETWLVGLQRTVPNVGFQSWTPHSAAEPMPQGFGLLRFE
ncbi:MAG: hypothetical protein KDA38_04425 [Planctomycetales bacterium]|nr:hypothetical protein [Planctomycetales bacterium]